ncbi:hypothetical protein HCA61_22900 [Rhodococcus sp. HNM0563]|nr:hypothetical protein [Rhodococcus sp. HNM0563]NLU65087.1 hypothetical protein [Rhodococcus sp. HNM0563]
MPDISVHQPSFATPTPLELLKDRVYAQRSSERREVGLDNVADDVDIGSEILVDEDVPAAGICGQAISGCASLMR